ncbi:serine protease MucD precursor [Marinomonas sp. MED121]|uniref:DegQ family serine endoprotease n=1 Tax=Marinomonas sp. MED121 TaxID=314277 RepID=UPI000069036F|nr:DegQ family serine endoprotease [Marinomonas sp. MED121]EAQ66558.1 serine protease MucD precursor [Marinomonas sp. MED121]
MIKRLHPFSIGLLGLLALISMGAKAVQLPDFTELVEDSSPAVVNISTEQLPATGQGQGQLNPNAKELNEFFRHFFGQQPLDKQPQRKQRNSLGSGFIISQDGYVLTNNHVIDGADIIHVRLNDRREYQAELVGTDKRTDLALLKIEADDLPTVKIGDSDDMKPGQWVLAIGSPFGFDYTVTAGIVSALGRNLPSDNYVPFIQTDVAINPGNSGGPLFNLDGEVIGINSQIYTRSGGFMGVSFAIPSNLVMSVVDQLKSEGRVTRAWLGVIIQDVSNDLAESFGLDRPSGALVSRVIPDSPAQAAGLMDGDIILEFNGELIEQSSELPYRVGALKAGDLAESVIYRNGKKMDLSFTLENYPSDPDQLTQTQQQENRLGMVVGEIPEDMLRRFKIKNGVVVEQVLGGSAARNGLQQGDVITMLNGTSIDSVETFMSSVSDIQANHSVPMRVIRDGFPMFIPFKIVE